MTMTVISANIGCLTAANTYPIRDVSESVPRCIQVPQT